MKRILLAIPHSHAWLWVQTCLSMLKRFPPKAEGYEIKVVVIDNSWNWSPSIRGVTETSLGEGITVLYNPKSCKFHASALDATIEAFDFDLFMAFETDVLALRPTWLQWFVDQLKDEQFAVGHWHHEQFVNPSCTLYRGSVLREMLAWCKNNHSPNMRWGPQFSVADYRPNEVEWVQGPFAEKRGWPEGTVLSEEPTGQRKGPGWYEPGQMLYHWARERKLGYKVCVTDTHQQEPGLPTGTFYGSMNGARTGLNFNDVEGAAEAVHLWGGTRALDIIKHQVECQFVKKWTPFWLKREAHFWRSVVPQDVQAATVELIKKHRWHIKGAGTPDVTDRDRAAVNTVESLYREEGIPL